MNTCSIVFTGDIGFDHHMANKWEDPELLSPEVLNFLHSGDHVVANVEGAMIERDKVADDGGKGRFFHTMDPAAISFLKLIKADIWNIANNHAMDAGLAGIQSTLKMAASMGSKTIGAGENLEQAMEPVILEEAGGIGILGAGFMPTCIRASKNAPGSLAWDEPWNIAKVIKKIKEKCRWCVVVCHGGEEFTSLPSPGCRNLYKIYLDLGADVVVAHHPHVPMNYETVGDKIIFYSLGNFIFDTDYQRAQPNTDTGLLLKLNFTEDKVGFEPFGTKIVRGEEHVIAGKIPAIFENIGEEEYQKLISLGSAAFLTNERHKAIFLKKFPADTPAETWDKYYHDFSQGGRVPGLHHDLATAAALAEKLDDGRYETSALEGVKKYMLDQLDK